MSQFFASSDQRIGALASASVLPMNIELISFRTDCFDFLAVQETLKSSPAPQFESIDSLVLSLLKGWSKVRLVFSITSYGKNPDELIGQTNKNIHRKKGKLSS